MSPLEIILSVAFAGDTYDMVVDVIMMEAEGMARFERKREGSAKDTRTKVTEK